MDSGGDLTGEWNLSRFLEADGFHQRGREEAGLGHIFARCAEHFDCVL